jgi:hypothetical protein
MNLKYITSLRDELLIAAANMPAEAVTFEIEELQDLLIASCDRETDFMELKVVYESLAKIKFDFRIRS